MTNTTRTARWSEPMSNSDDEDGNTTFKEADTKIRRATGPGRVRSPTLSLRSFSSLLASAKSLRGGPDPPYDSSRRPHWDLVATSGQVRGIYGGIPRGVWDARGDPRDLHGPLPGPGPPETPRDPPGTPRAPPRAPGDRQRAHKDPPRVPEGIPGTSQAPLRHPQGPPGTPQGRLGAVPAASF